MVIVPLELIDVGVIVPEELIVAIDSLPDDQVPPEIVEANVVVLLEQIACVPPLKLPALGGAVMVTILGMEPEQAPLPIV